MSLMLQVLWSTFLVSLLISTTNGRSSSVEDAVDEQLKTACLLETNHTLRNSFELSIREEHGNIEEGYRGDRHALASEGFESLVTCFSQFACHDSNYTWCINVYHPTEEIELCYSSFTGDLINATDHALLLGLDSTFSLPNKTDCPKYRPGCLRVEAPLFLSKAYLTCTSESDTCYKKEFTELQVPPKVNFTVPPVVTIINDTNELVLGETNVYYCIVEFKSMSSLFSFSSWLLNDSNVDIISENPFCQSNCHEDYLASEAKKKRIRVYVQTRITNRSCFHHYDLVHYNWLVIDNATVEDAQLPYSCYGEKYLGTEYSSHVKKDLSLNPVPPLQDVEVFEVPPSGETHYKLGDEIGLTVSFEAGEGDDLVWMLNGSPLEDTAVDMGFDCSKSTSDDQLPPVFSTPVRVDKVGRFKRNFASTLHICGIDSSTVGLYECVISRTHGENITIWSGKIELLTDTAEDDAAVNPLVLYISIPSVVLIFMLVPLVVVVVCVRRQRKRSARLSGRFEGLILEGKDIGGKEPDDESKLMQFCYPLEYSTSNELDIPLGEDTLDGNMAVKTIKKK